MAEARRRQGATPPGQSPQGGRPGLIPADPLPGWKALVQAALLLGIPIALLLVTKVILKTYFPALGY
jgi:hypothetical protein